MMARRSDLPLSADPASRFLPWLVAVMVLLAALATAVVFLLRDLEAQWRQDAAGTLTVQVLPPAAASAGDAREALAARVEKALAVLEATPGVAAARPLPREEATALLEPWLGGGDLVAELPLPALIDVRLDDALRIDTDALAGRLREAVPGAAVDDHRLWLQGLIDLGATLEGLGLGALALMGGALTLTVVYATRTGLAIHRDIIDLLHLVGAQDDYIARQFAAHSLRLGLRGGLLGLALSAPALGLLVMAAGTLEGGLLPPLTMPAGGWVAVVLLPLGAALLAWGTARLTVRHVLARMF